MSELHFHRFWTEHFSFIFATYTAQHMHTMKIESKCHWTKILILWEFIPTQTPLNSVLSHKTLCVYLFYRQSHLEFQPYCASHQRCIWGWKELRDSNTNDCLWGYMELYHLFHSSKWWGGNHWYYLNLLLPDSANSDLCRHVKQKNGFIKIKIIQLALRQDSG